MALMQAITLFAQEFNNGEDNFGTITILPEERTTQFEPALRGQLRTFYASVDFDELIIGNTFFLEIATADKLPRYQEGWLYVFTNGQKEYEDTQNWRESWVVFGDRNGDAIFSKLEDDNSPIYGSIQKRQEFKLASSLESFLTILTACLVVEEEEFGFETKNEDYSFKEEFIAKTTLVVEQYESPETAHSFVQYFFS